MAYFEIRGGLKKLEFERLPGSSDEATRAVVEFVYPLPLAAGQCARTMLGLHNGVERELIGVPEFLGVCGPRSAKPEYLYRLCGAITASQAISPSRNEA